MSKYDSLWEYVRKNNEKQMVLTFDEIQEIAGVPIDHSFLTYKKGMGRVWVSGWENLYERKNRCF